MIYLVPTILIALGVVDLLEGNEGGVVLVTMGVVLGLLCLAFTE